MAPLLVLLAAASAWALELGPCAGVRTESVSPARAAAGETVVLEGSFGDRSALKSPRANKGATVALKIVEWTPRRVTARLPRSLPPGAHKVGVSCFYDGESFSSGWHDLKVGPAGPPGPEAAPDEPEPALELPGDPREILGLALALWQQERAQDAFDAYGTAADVFKGLGDLEREGRARRGRAWAAAAMGRAEEADAENTAAVGLYYDAMNAAPADQRRRLELAYADLGGDAARAAVRRGQPEEAERIQRIRLEIFERHEDPGGQAVAWQGLAEAAAAGERHDEALERFDKAAGLYRRLKNPHGVDACEDGARAARKAMSRPGN